MEPQFTCTGAAQGREITTPQSGLIFMLKFGKGERTAALVRVDPMEFADLRGQVKAIGRSQAVIEFALDGTIQTANENFLSAVGYSLEEVRGQHHRMFVEPAERETAA